MGKRSRQLVDEAFHEVRGQRPARVKHTKRKRGEAEARKMETAIAMDLAKKRGAKL